MGEVAIRKPILPRADELEVMTTLAKTFVEAGLFQGIKDISQALVKIQAGQEIGLRPFAAMNGIDVIPGRNGPRCVPSAATLNAVIRASGKYVLAIKQMDHEACEIAVAEKVGPEGQIVRCGPNVRFTIEDARRAGLAGKETYKSYTADMLFSRCISRVGRRYCGDVCAGLWYTKEDLEDGIWEEDPASDTTVEVVTETPEEAVQALQEPKKGKAKNGRRKKKAAKAKKIEPEVAEVLDTTEEADIEYQDAKAPGEATVDAAEEEYPGEVDERGLARDEEARREQLLILVRGCIKEAVDGAAGQAGAAAIVRGVTKRRPKEWESSDTKKLEELWLAFAGTTAHATDQAGELFT